MFEKNELIKITKCFDKCQNIGEIVSAELKKLLLKVDKIYSYRLLVVSQDNKDDYFKVEVLLSQNLDWNQVDKNEVIDECIFKILQHCNSNTHEYVVSFKQPPIDLMLQLYEPLVKKLSERESRRWKLEYEDVCQICRLCIVILYKKEYYIHKSLIETIFIREVLKYVSKDKYKPTVLSIYDLDKKDKELVDEIEDLSAQDDFDYIIDGVQETNEERRQKVIGLIGQRQYDQLLVEYRNKMTTNSSRKLVNKLKEKFNVSQ